MTLRFSLLLLPLTLAACGSEPDGPPPDLGSEVTIEDVAEGSGPEVEPAVSEADADESDGPKLQSITYQDFADKIEAALGCSFHSGDGELLLVSSAPDDRDAGGAAALMVGDEVVVLQTERAGGFEYLQSGPAFRTEAMTAAVARAAGEGVKVGSDSLMWPAELTVAEEEGGTTTYPDGQWSCGA